jgi:hypothetical protein
MVWICVAILAERRMSALEEFWRASPSSDADGRKPAPFTGALQAGARRLERQRKGCGTRGRLAAEAGRGAGLKPALHRLFDFGWRRLGAGTQEVEQGAGCV